MFEVNEPSDFHDRRNRCEEVYYFCNCDRLSGLCRGPRNSWFGLGHTEHTYSGVRQPYIMKTGQRWIFLAIIVAAVFVLLLMWGSGGGSGSGRNKSGPLNIHINLEELTERNKCPACFGVNLCPQIIQGKIKLSDWTKYSVTKFVNQKNVFYAEWNDRGIERKLILKKLAHNNELKELDKAICERHGRDDKCDVSQTVQYLIDEYAHESEVHPGKEILHGAKIGKGSDILLCPSQRKMDFLIEAANKFHRGQHKKTILANVLTTILLNPEPLMLEAFASNDGWPFPQYYGSCGRIVAEEYVGRSLTQYINEPFKTRALLAKQLLEMANFFMENPTNFVLYITDPSPDNFAINEDTNTLKMIDLENIIVVDKEKLLLSKAGDKLLVSQSLNCDEKMAKDLKCFTFITEDLCNRRLTDHNYYAVCAGLLATEPLAMKFPQGLLHSIPGKDKAKLSQLPELLQQCKDPSQGSLNMNRIEAAEKILHVLNDYLDNNFD